MTKFKKLLSVLLVFVLCFAVCGVIASAADEQPIVMVYTSYANNEATQVRLTIKTNVAYAAIAGTITYTGVTLADGGHVFAEDTNDAKYQDNDGVVKFALVTDKFTGEVGDQYWASFLFEVENENDINFTVSNAQVADFNANAAITPTYKVALVNTISTVGSLGSQFRPQTNETTAALRFGAKLERNQNSNNEVTVDGNAYEAVACGAILGYEFNIKVNGTKLSDLSTLKNYFKVSGATLVKDDTKNLTGAKVYVSSKYLESTKDYLAYTFAISGLNKVHDGHNLAEEAIVFLPYTIYDKGNDVYDVEFGEPISQSYTTVNEIYDFVKPAQQ